jgi:hypothetical protein
MVLVERVCSRVGDKGGDGVLGGFGRGGRMPCLRRASLLELWCISYNFEAEGEREEGIRYRVGMQEIGFGPLSSQFSVFIRIRVRHLV